MSSRVSVRKISGTSPASASTAVVGSPISGLCEFDWFIIDAKLIGGTGGTAEFWLQRKIADEDIWTDWARFPQMAAGATKYYSFQVGANTTISEVSQGTTASPGSPVIAANTFLGGHPGDQIRLVCTANVGTSVGAAQVIHVQGWKHK